MEVRLSSVAFWNMYFYEYMQMNVSLVYDFIYLITQESGSRAGSAKSPVGEKNLEPPLSVVRVICMFLKEKNLFPLNVVDVLYSRKLWKK